MGDCAVAEAVRWVMLTGGPPEMTRLHRLADDACKRGAMPSMIAVPFYGRHQHFACTDATEVAGGRPVPVFRFVYSTAIAE